MRRRTPIGLIISLALAAACADNPTPTAPEIKSPVPGGPNNSRALALVTCTASVQQRAVDCELPGARAADGTSYVIMGGQDNYIKLTTSNIQILADSFTFDLSVKNLIPQPIGTTNGNTAHAEGVRVFFTSGPTSSAAGTISVANADGTGTFTAPSQPYFQYDGILEQDDVSPAKKWKLRFTPEVTSFTFNLLVSAQVQYPDGYIDGLPYVISLNPSEARALTGTVRNFLGVIGPDQTIGWSSDAPSTAAISGTQVTAGASNGFATLTPSAGSAVPLWTTAVSVCPATVVTNGANLPSSIAASDCFSSYGSNSGRPTVQYYADLFRVTLTAGQTIEVQMDSGDDLDTYLLIAAPGSGFLVAGNDDDDDGILGVGSRMRYTATVSGVYVIEASTFNELDTGGYTLKVAIN